jgi:hypothetical protein
MLFISFSAMLLWITGQEEVVKVVMDASIKLDNETLPTNHINYKLLDENVNLRLHLKYLQFENTTLIKHVKNLFTRTYGTILHVSQ